ncbi:hypothetical protein ADMFC3_00420 [Geovibrio sp. ADMFC3]
MCRKEDFRKQITIGTIFVTTWGYEQTNVDAYQVVGITSASVKLRKIKTEIVRGTGFMSAEVKPLADNFVGEAFTKRINKGYVRFEYGGCDLWDGKRTYNQTSYA